MAEPHEPWTIFGTSLDYPVMPEGPVAQSCAAALLRGNSGTVDAPPQRPHVSRAMKASKAPTFNITVQFACFVEFQNVLAMLSNKPIVDSSRPCIQAESASHFPADDS